MKFHTVSIISIEPLGRYFVLEYPWPGRIEPGQFVMARHAGYPVSLDPFLARPLSVYDHDGETASLLFEVRGRGTQLLSEARETIEVSAPVGNSFDVSETTRRAALLGGGVGIAPFRFLSRRLTERNIPHDTFLGFADSEFAAASSDLPDAHVATMDGSAGTSGTVLDAVDSRGSLTDYDAIFACGPNAMLAAIKLAAPTTALCQVSVEERMGCGNGSCNGCVVPITDRGYVRSCVEGPVFDAPALAW